MKEKDEVRGKVRDADFADEQMDLRIERREKQWGKQMKEHGQKMEIVRLN